MQRYEIRTCGKCDHFPEGKGELDFVKCRQLPGVLTVRWRERNFSGCYEPRKVEPTHEVSEGKSL